MISRRTMGIDEAGRGPAIGPMVMAAVILDTRAARALTRAGLSDSKSYGPGARGRAARADLAARIMDRAERVDVSVIDADIIDRRVACKELNVLEREVAVRFIDAAPAVDRIIADGVRLFQPLCGRYSHLMVWNKAETRHAAVAAASVVAKHRRDTLFAEIAARYADEFGEVIGGGYVNDGTRRFLCAYARKYGCLPPEARRSWPHPYVVEVLGPDFDPWADAPDRRAQLALL